MKKEKNMLMKVYSALASRAQLMSRLGQQYGGDRDIYQALGYSTVLKYEDYAAQYSRQDMARAVIDRPAKTTWQGLILVVESDDDEETALEKEWKALYKDLGLASIFLRLDKLTGIGCYGALLLGLDDVQTSNDLARPVNPGQRKLLYVKPLGEGSATINTWNRNTSDKRFGQPETYTITISSANETTTTATVHWSRIIHTVDGLLESEIEGTPRLKAIFNRLKDLEKIVGASAEMFWRGGRPGYQGKLDKDYQMTTETKADLKDQIDEYENNLRRILVNEGVELSALESQISDPSNHVDIQIQMISSETGIPKRILTGSERGELASTQDMDMWFSLITDRRINFAEPNVLRPFIDRCIEYKILSSPKEKYNVVWSDLFALSKKEQAEIGKTRGTALKDYSLAALQGVDLPEKALYRHILVLDDDEIELIEQEKLAETSEEETFLNSE